MSENTGPVSQPCPLCSGRGMIPTPGHTEADLDAAYLASMERSRERFEERAARRAAERDQPDPGAA